MSEAENPEPDSSGDDKAHTGGFNLAIAYGLLGFALLAALCIALFIVMPFYHRR